MRTDLEEDRFVAIGPVSHRVGLHRYNIHSFRVWIDMLPSQDYMCHPKIDIGYPGDWIEAFAGNE
jgi:hypothetical protein